MSDEVDARVCSYWLILFLGLFLFRVLAQLVQAIYPVPVLPLIESWQSGALPYPLLVSFQIAIVAFCVREIVKFRSKTMQPKRTAGSIYLALGGIYFAIMTFRLVAGLSFASQDPWLGAHIPTIFHLVLASFLLTIGFYHSPDTKRIVAWSAYPAIMVAARCRAACPSPA